ncbi:hypothetical protein [Rhizobium leguminosarum]|uniref:hypothetical protein n=1 Tax=Rhizobium leguminosarum TaxID=384 RepID=UPI00144227DD|nr:hypothetical protein [Rhizobium leguminosarum]MBY5868781.1 hypothetical protein [Rhizobium leguminosarum]NKM06209.1 hypothetical protein [Rhizobium leguminosarum bv. viciae]
MYHIAGMYFIEKREIARSPEEVTAIALLMGIEIESWGNLYRTSKRVDDVEALEMFYAAIKQKPYTSYGTGDNDDDI